MGEVNIVVDVMGAGWVMIHAVMPTEFQRQVEFERIPHLINQTFVTWMRQNPGIGIFATQGIVEDGYTIALHVWFGAAK